MVSLLLTICVCLGNLLACRGFATILPTQKGPPSRFLAFSATCLNPENYRKRFRSNHLPVGNMPTGVCQFMTLLGSCSMVGFFGPLVSSEQVCKGLPNGGNLGAIGRPCMSRLLTCRLKLPTTLSKHRKPIPNRWCKAPTSCQTFRL